MRKILIHTLMLAALTGSGCSIYRVPIEQGNLLEAKDIARLQVGMNKRQVTFIMGTALLQDPFHNNRWDYVNSVKEKGKPLVRQRLTLYFKNDTLVKIDDSDLQPVAIKR